MPFVIPYFIAHQGCPHQCLFCNQQVITGEKFSSADIAADITRVVRQWLGYRKNRGATHFAFYGGSFTCLPEERQRIMLDAVAPWLKSGEIDLLRLSTRPDCIDMNSCELLKEHGVGIVELGVQSLDDKVLVSARRGHDAGDCYAAAHLLKNSGFEVGIQLMPGLPGETRLSFMKTVRRTIILNPSFVRIYPTVVVRNSELAKQYGRGEYTPLTLDKAVLLTAWARQRFLGNNIRVARMGLQPSRSLDENVVAGPYHPAFGEMVRAREWFRRTRKLLAENGGKKLRLTISPRDLSCFYGVNKVNKYRLEELGLAQRLEVTVDKNLERESMHHVVC